MQIPPHLPPNMMGGMFTVPPQMWMQPPAASAQTGAMEVDDDVPQPWDNKYSSSKEKKNMFCFSVSLRVICCASECFDSKKSHHLFQDMRVELGSSV